MDNHDTLDPKIEDEVLRSRIRKLIDEKPKPSVLQRVSTNPLASIIVAFVLTGLVGGFLTNHYNSKQKELEGQRTEELRESDRLREDQQRTLDRKREDDRRESDRIRADQQRESDRLYQVRQKDTEYHRALQQRESERLRDVRQKDFEDQLRKKELVERLDIEIGYRYSQVLIRLYDLTDRNPKRPTLAKNRTANDVKKVLELIKQPATGNITPLYSEFANMSIPGLIADQRRYLGTEDERSNLDAALNHVTGYFFDEIDLSDVEKVAGLILDKLMIQRWKQGYFYFIDCRPSAPFC